MAAGVTAEGKRARAATDTTGTVDCAGERLRGGGLPQAQLLASEQQGERMRDAGQMRRLPSLHDKLWWGCGDRDGGKDKRTCWVIQEEITTHHRSRPIRPH